MTTISGILMSYIYVITKQESRHLNTSYCTINPNL